MVLLTGENIKEVMKPFKYREGQIVKIINGGLTYPRYRKYFISMGFKNQQYNSWSRWYNYIEDCNEKFIIDNYDVHENGFTHMYKITCISNPDIEFLIEESGIILEGIFFNKIKII